MWQKFELAIELAKELAFLRRKVNGYFVVHSTENGVLRHTDMSMEQGWEMHFSAILEPQNPKFSFQLQTWWVLWETLYQANNSPELRSQLPCFFWNLEALQVRTLCWYTEPFCPQFVHDIIHLSAVLWWITIQKKEFVLWIVAFFKSFFKMLMYEVWY